MTDAYLLPCECGESLRIKASQAGEEILCACGRTVEAPSLSALRALEHDEEQSTDPPERRQWSAVAGAVFAIGALVMMLGLAVGCFGLISRMQLTVPEPPQEEVAAWIAQIDEAPIDEMWDVWEATLNEGLGEYRQPYLLIQREAAFFGIVCGAGFGAAAAGLAIIGSTAWLWKGNLT